MPAVPSITPEELRRLSAGRWLIPILATMASESGSRFSALAHRLAMSRSILSKSLDRLEELGLVDRNPGHGHPLRPEYLLTPRGRPIADWARTVIEQHRRLDIAPQRLGRWALPVVAALRAEPKRFSVLQRSLAPVTARALSLELGALRSTDLIDRLPPQPLYGLTARGLALARSVGAA